MLANLIHFSIIKTNILRLKKVEAASQCAVSMATDTGDAAEAGFACLSASV